MYYLVYLCRLEPIKHRARLFPASCSPLLQSCYLLFIELVSRAKQENLSWSNVSFILRELQLLVRSRVFCRVSSEIKKYNFEMKKPSRWTILVHAIALHGESFRWAAVSTEYVTRFAKAGHNSAFIEIHFIAPSRFEH